MPGGGSATFSTILSCFLAPCRVKELAGGPFLSLTDFSLCLIDLDFLLRSFVRFLFLHFFEGVGLCSLLEQDEESELLYESDDLYLRVFFLDDLDRDDRFLCFDLDGV